MREAFTIERPPIYTVEATVFHWSALAVAFAVIAISNSSATFQIFAYRNVLVWMLGANAVALAAILIACHSNTTRRPAAVLAVLWAMMQPLWIAVVLDKSGVQMPAFMETLSTTWRGMVLFRGPRRIMSPDVAAVMTWAFWAMVAVAFTRRTGRFDSLGKLLALATVLVVLITWTIWAFMPLLKFVA
jgi:hypothetical protein